MKAKALVFRKANVPQIETVVLPGLRDDEMLVKIHYSGVSIGTESSIINGTRTHNGTFPLVPGYMASGVVEQVGKAVVGVKVGDRVVSMATRLDAGIKAVFGGHCSYHVSSSVTPVPDNLDMRDASMWILPRVGLNAVKMANVTEDDVVLICGQGLIGQFCGQWAVARGAKVIVVEPDKLRAGLARKYVTRNVLDPFAGDLEKTIGSLTDGQWPTVVIEATANKKLIAQTSGFIRRMHARMVFLSWYPGEITIDFSHFHNYEATVFFPMGAGSNDGTGVAVLEGLARGTVTMGDNLSDGYHWKDAVKGYDRICAGDRSIMGMTIDWRDAQ